MTKWPMGRGAAAGTTALAAAVATLVIGEASVVADAPPGHFTVNAAADTVTDNETGLVWQRTAPAGTYTHAQALAYCPTRGAGWRVPTPLELRSIVDETLSSPAIDPSAFPGTRSEAFWTSSPVAGSSGLAWVVDFNIGYLDDSYASYAFRARCVR